MERIFIFRIINWEHLLSALSFLSFNISTRYLLPALAPQVAKETDQKLWKWRNTVNSLIHSTITGVFSFTILLTTPQLRSDLISTGTVPSLALTSITFGYFIYDLIDLAVYHFKPSTYSLILHHTLVIFCFGLALFTKRYQGYSMYALLVEINSIFLHLRQILILQGANKKECNYKLVSWANLVTFFLFRFVTLIWQTVWLLENRTNLPRAVFHLGNCTNFAILILNFFLLRQLLEKDFFGKSEKRKI